MSAFPNISNVLFGQNSPMASPPMAQMLPPANTPPVPGPAQPSMPVAAQQPQSNDLDQLVKQLTAAYTKQVIQANQGNLGQDKNLFLPNTGFFGNHPNLSRAIESGMTAASMVQPSSTTGGAIGQTAAALLGMPGALAQAKFQRSALPMQQTGAMLNPLLEMQKTQAQIQDIKSQAIEREASQKRAEGYYQKMVDQGQLEIAQMKKLTEGNWTPVDPANPYVQDKESGQWSIQVYNPVQRSIQNIPIKGTPERYLEAQAKATAKTPPRSSAVRQYIDRNLPAAAKSMGLDPESLSDEDKAKVENNLEFEYRRKNADINAIAHGAVPGYVAPNTKERIGVLQHDLQGRPKPGSITYEILSPEEKADIQAKQKELDSLSKSGAIPTGTAPPSSQTKIPTYNPKTGNFE